MQLNGLPVECFDDEVGAENVAQLGTVAVATSGHLGLISYSLHTQNEYCVSSLFLVIIVVG